MNSAPTLRDAPMLRNQPMLRDTPMLRIEGVNQYYGGSHILRDVSFSLPRAACTSLLGRNGVGKTTLLKCLVGLVPVKTGSLWLDGQDITRMPPYQRARLGIGYVPQGREIFPRLTVQENLLMGLASRPAGKAGDGAAGAAASVAGIPSRIFDMFPVLHDMLHRRGGDLSGGQQQQLAIGRALAGDPRLLILDEPTEGIQPSIIKDIERVIAMLVKQGDMAVLLVEQYYDFARSLADHYVVMSRGEVVRSGAGADMERDNVRSLLSI